ncbi:hypothetical protein ADEAN_000430200 [Angomonas deanei]|uniref:Uncharacterized protein n=1 Tax=Angomonas deanei TaxID=59799 RepID=A0A7G2CDA3_9TRYP|nr:hypothetical protein ADEAN_000430200 [Angomonas deanei]
MTNSVDSLNVEVDLKDDFREYATDPEVELRKRPPFGFLTSSDMLNCSSLLSVSEDGTTTSGRQFFLDAKEFLHLQKESWDTLSCEMAKLREPSFLEKAFESPQKVEYNRFKRIDDRHVKEVQEHNRQQMILEDCCTCLTHGQHLHYLPFLSPYLLYQRDPPHVLPTHPDMNKVVEYMKEETKLYLHLLKNTFVDHVMEGQVYEGDDDDGEDTFYKYSAHYGKAYLESRYVLPFIRRYRQARHEKFVVPFLEGAKEADGPHMAPPDDDAPTDGKKKASSFLDDLQIWNLIDHTFESQYVNSNREHTTVRSRLLTAVDPSSVFMSLRREVRNNFEMVYHLPLEHLEQLWTEEQKEEEEKESAVTVRRQALSLTASLPINSRVALDKELFQGSNIRNTGTHAKKRVKVNSLEDKVDFSTVQRTVLSVDEEALLTLLTSPWDLIAHRMPVRVECTRVKAAGKEKLSLWIHIGKTFPSATEKRETLFAAAMKQLIEDDKALQEKVVAYSKDGKDKETAKKVASFVTLERPTTLKDDAFKTGSNTDTQKEELPFILFGEAFGFIRRDHSGGPPTTHPAFHVVKMQYLNNGHSQGGTVRPTDQTPSAPYLQERLTLREVLQLYVYLHCYPGAVVYVHHVHPYHTPSVFRVDGVHHTNLDSYLREATTGEVREMAKVAWDVVQDALQSCVKYIALAALRHWQEGRQRGDTTEEKVFHYILTKYTDREKKEEVEKGKRKRRLEKRLVALQLSAVGKLYKAYNIPFSVAKEAEADGYIEEVHDDPGNEDLEEGDGSSLERENTSQLEERLPYSETHFLNPVNWPVKDRIPFSFPFAPS